jgi:hypothetical protein
MSSVFFANLFVSDVIAVIFLIKAANYEVPHLIFFIVPER